jgi:hypothetical protein
VAKIAASQWRDHAVTYTSDQRVDQLLLKCPNNFRKLEQFGRGFGNASDHLVELEEALNEVRGGSDKLSASPYVKFATNYRFARGSKVLRDERGGSEKVVPFRSYVLHLGIVCADFSHRENPASVGHLGLSCREEGEYLAIPPNRPLVDAWQIFFKALHPQLI